MQLQLTSYYLLSFIIYYPLSHLLSFIIQILPLKTNFFLPREYQEEAFKCLKTSRRIPRGSRVEIFSKDCRRNLNRVNVHRLTSINLLNFIAPNKPRIFDYPLYCYILIIYFHSNLFLRKRKRSFKKALRRTRKRSETKSDKPSSALDFAKVPQVFRGETRRRWLPGRTGGCEPCLISNYDSRAVWKAQWR